MDPRRSAIVDPGTVVARAQGRPRAMRLGHIDGKSGFPAGCSERTRGGLAMVSGVRSRFLLSAALFALGCGGKHPGSGAGEAAAPKADRAADLPAAVAPGAGVDDPAGTALGVPSPDARKTLAALRARTAGESGAAARVGRRLSGGDGRIAPLLRARREGRAVAVTFPMRATSRLTIVDSASGAGIEVAVEGRAQGRRRDG